MPDRITVYKTLLSDRNRYRLWWVMPGTTRRRSQSARTADEAAAEQARQELEYELNHGLHRDTVRVSWEDFAARYLAEKLADRRERTRKKWLTVSAALVRLSRPRSLGDVTADLLSRHAAALRASGLAKPTLAGHLAYLRAALRWAKRIGLLAAAPTVEMPRLPKVRFKRTTDHQGFLRLLNAADGPWRLLISLAWYTGRRRGELLALEWDGANGRPWLDLDRARLWLPAGWNKSDADQWYPLHPDLVATLQTVRRDAGPVLVGLPATQEQVSVGFRQVAEAAGVNVRLHDLRRSFCSRYARLVPAQVLQRLAGHASIATTLAFYVDLEGGLDEAIRLG